ncbi:uncharacterized protein LAJ45_05294 [Morchella importuna]|uniref:uncharacterized protein n=1 Tax=Morchella importuna TaxID=1174673 RepID=UPI001E8D4A95|nr:uncharacterized protein LAJ45_05294 [Morchella importuna]KAH8150598.1 hypothetical protein LAJ45_05294 [Morchella importuna]
MTTQALLRAFLLLVAVLLLASRAIAQNNNAKHMLQAPVPAEPIAALSAGWALQTTPCPASTHGGPPRATAARTGLRWSKRDECVRAVEARPACADTAWVLWLDERDGGRFCCGSGGEDEECLGVRDGGGGSDLRRRQETTEAPITSTFVTTVSPTATTLVYAYLTTYWTNHYTTTGTITRTSGEPGALATYVVHNEHSATLFTTLVSVAQSRSTSITTRTPSTSRITPTPITTDAPLPTTLPTDTPITTPTKSSRNRNRTIGIAVATAGAVVALIGFIWRCHSRRRRRRRSATDVLEADGVAKSAPAELPVVTTQQIMVGGQGQGQEGAGAGAGGAPAQGTYTWELVYRPPVVEGPPVELPAGQAAQELEAGRGRVEEAGRRGSNIGGRRERG